VVFAADRHDAEAGFDDAAIHSQLAGGAPAVPVDEDPRSDRLTPFQAWDAFEERVGYCSDKQ